MLDKLRQNQSGTLNISFVENRLLVLKIWPFLQLLKNPNIINMLSRSRNKQGTQRYTFVPNQVGISEVIGLHSK